MIIFLSSEFILLEHVHDENKYRHVDKVISFMITTWNYYISTAYLREKIQIIIYSLFFPFQNNKDNRVKKSKREMEKEKIILVEYFFNTFYRWQVTCR